MSTPTVLIRLIAQTIGLVRYRTIRSSDAKFLVFTGTSGKTLARYATAFALRKRGFPVVSPPYGYTNELGIVLAALGIESIKLFSWSGLKKIMTARPPRGAFICVEIGADWYPDINWFLQRFTPYGVCITDMATIEWTRPVPQIWAEKKRLIEQVRSDGFVCFSSSNSSHESIDALSISPDKKREYTVLPIDPEWFEYIGNGIRQRFKSTSASFTPHREALGCAITCVRAIDLTADIPADFFATYGGVPERLSDTRLPSGALVIADTYKAVPLCTEYVINVARSIPAKRRIAVISELRPLWRNENLHYHNLGNLLQSFDEVYFVGPKRIFSLLVSHVANLHHVPDESHYRSIAFHIAKQADAGTVIVVKGAGRFHLSRLISLLGLVE